MVILLRALLFGGVIALGAYCFFDVIRTDAERVGSLDKLVWMVVVLLPVLGPAAWLLLGRPVPVTSRLSQQHPQAPDDSPEFLASLADEIRRRRRAEQLRGGTEDIDRDKIEDAIDRLEEDFRQDEDPDAAS